MADQDSRTASIGQKRGREEYEDTTNFRPINGKRSRQSGNYDELGEGASYFTEDTSGEISDEAEGEGSDEFHDAIEVDFSEGEISEGEISDAGGVALEMNTGKNNNSAKITSSTPQVIPAGHARSGKQPLGTVSEDIRDIKREPPLATSPAPYGSSHTSSHPRHHAVPVVVIDDSPLQRRPSSRSAPVDMRLRDLSDTERRFQKLYFHLDSPDAIARCTTCSYEGHLADNCPERECRHCGELDTHFTIQCPTWVKCSRCRERGHDAEDCDSLLKHSEADGHGICDYCSKRGHAEEQCPKFWRTFDPEELSGLLHKTRNCIISCYNCGKWGHWGDDCPKRKRKWKVSTSYCFSRAYASHFFVEGNGTNFFTPLDERVPGRSGPVNTRPGHRGGKGDTTQPPLTDEPTPSPPLPRDGKRSRGGGLGAKVARQDSKTNNNDAGSDNTSFFGKKVQAKEQPKGMKIKFGASANAGHRPNGGGYAFDVNDRDPPADRPALGSRGSRSNGVSNGLDADGRDSRRGGIAQPPSRGAGIFHKRGRGLSNGAAIGTSIRMGKYNAVPPPQSVAPPPTRPKRGSGGGNGGGGRGGGGSQNGGGGRGRGGGGPQRGGPQNSGGGRGGATLESGEHGRKTALDMARQRYARGRG